ncbi:MAG: exonuclease domain-containing protein [Vicingaceae bacterium]
MYAIVDLETTGGSAVKSRITEIAIYLHDGKKVIDEYQTLINPKREIPPKISRLTGITNEMVANAPTFEEVAQHVDDFTEDYIFVAHNVNFDYGFLRESFQRIGKSYRRKKLCTVRLSRKLLPGKFSYSLGKLCATEGIPLSNRHRAAGDAKATAILFSKLLRLDKEGVIEKSLNPQSLEALLPPNLPKADFTALPEEQGLYYFKDQKGKVVYIGQAKNIKKRVHSHFSGNSNTKSKYHFVKNVYGLDFKLIPNKLLLDLFEATEIKQKWPRYNRAMKRFSLNFGLYSYEDRKGYQRLSIGRCGKHDKPIHTFAKLADATAFLKKLVEKYNLCPRLSGLQPLGSGACSYFEEMECKGACQGKELANTYNNRVEQAIKEEVHSRSTYLIKEQLPGQDNCAVVLVEKGRYKGFAHLDPNENIDSLAQIKSRLTAAYDDQDMANLIQAYLAKNNKLTELSYFS